MAASMTSRIAELENAIAQQHEQDPFSGVIWIKENGKLILAKSYGFANRSEAIPNTLNTRFGIASGTKLFTSVAICQLVEKKLLTFDTLLKDCLDIPFPSFDPTVSVRHLLTHSSGIPDYFNEAEMDDYEELWVEKPMYSLRKLEDYLPMFQSREMAFSPGERFAYNNAGYILLGLIVEQASGQRFQDYVETHIFKVCDMTENGFFLTDALPSNTAYGYIQSDSVPQSWRTNIYAIPIVGSPDGGAYTTARDMSNFWQMLTSHRLLSASTLKQLMTAHTKDDDDWYYGYGIWIQKQEASSSYHLFGEDPGVRFYSELDPSRDLQIILIGNVAEPFLQMRNCILDLMSPQA